ncbi:dihydroneopterin aldolase [Puniceicoccaceae bacterium K14]|nr:dihydroneopterin aldolase [Puniceicoccaceae bacterium K14]
MDKIFLKGVRLFGRIGVFDSEKANGQFFVIDITLHTSLRDAGKTDNLEKTVSYADVFEDAKKLMDEMTCDLVETYAENLSDLLFEKYEKVNRIAICIGKPDAPIEGNFESVGVEIDRMRDD